MYIALVTAGFPPEVYGGLQVHVLDMARELLRRGHQVLVTTCRPWREDQPPVAECEEEVEGVPVLGLGVDQRRAGQTVRESLASGVLGEYLSQALTRRRVDLVHCHDLVAGLLPYLARGSRPWVQTIHGPECLCPSGNLLRPDGALCEVAPASGVCRRCAAAKRAPGWRGRVLGCLPLAHFLGRRLDHGPLDSYLKRGLHYPYSVAQRLHWLRELWRQCPCLVAPSACVVNRLQYAGVPADRIHLLRHGITPFARQPLPPLAGRPLRLAYAGRLSPDKGLGDLFTALAGLPPDASCELHLCGQTQNAYEAQLLAGWRAGLPAHVRLVEHGRVPHAAMGERLAAVDLLILPSAGFEVFGLVVQEAFSVGRPVIVVAGSGPAEQVRDGVDGLVVPRDHPVALRAALEQLIHRPEWVATWAANVRPVRTIADHVDELLALYAARRAAQPP